MSSHLRIRPMKISQHGSSPHFVLLLPSALHHSFLCKKLSKSGCVPRPTGCNENSCTAGPSASYGAPADVPSGTADDVAAHSSTPSGARRHGELRVIGYVIAHFHGPREASCQIRKVIMSSTDSGTIMGHPRVAPPSRASRIRVRMGRFLQVLMASSLAAACGFAPPPNNESIARSEGDVARAAKDDPTDDRRQLRRVRWPHRLTPEVFGDEDLERALHQAYVEGDFEAKFRDPYGYVGVTPELERISREDRERLTGMLQQHGYPLHLRRPLSRPSEYVPRVKMGGLASAMVYEFNLVQPGGRRIELLDGEGNLVDAEEAGQDPGDVVEVRMRTGMHQQAAWYHEYYDEDGNVWEKETGISHLAWSENPESLLTDRPVIGVAEKAHAIKVEGDVFSDRCGMPHFTHSARIVCLTCGVPSHRAAALIQELRGEHGAQGGTWTKVRGARAHPEGAERHGVHCASGPSESGRPLSSGSAY